MSDIVVYKYLKEGFEQPPLLNASVGVNANLNWEIVGTNAANAGSTFAAGGGLNLATAGANNDQIIVVPHQDAVQTWIAASGVWNTDRSLVLRWQFRTVASIATMTICMGVRSLNTLQSGANALATTTDADAFLVRYAAADGVALAATTAIGNTDTTTPITTTTVNTTYDIVWRMRADRTGTVYVNGDPVLATAAMTASTSLGVPFFGIQANSAAVKNVRLLAMEVGLIPTSD